MTNTAINTNGATKVTVKDMKPYMVSMEDLESFDNDELASVKKMISREINGLDIDFSIPGRIEVELKYFDRIVSKGIEVVDSLKDAIKDYSSSIDDEDTNTLLSSMSILSGVKDILGSFGEYKEALEGGDPANVEAVYKSAFIKALIREVDLVKSAPYCTADDIEELMSSALEQIKQCMSNEFDVEKTPAAYDQLLDRFDQVKDMISNDFESFADMVA